MPVSSQVVVRDDTVDAGSVTPDPVGDTPPSGGRKTRGVQ